MVKKAVQIGIVAGEPSGDNLGAGLINALKSKLPNASYVGIGGPKMRAAGCDTLYDMDQIELMGVDGLFGKLGDILKIRSALFRKFKNNPPDLFIGIDVPDFNIGLEYKLKKRKIRTIHYVSPTVWAWRGYRIHKIRRAVSHMLTLFPFEARYYEKHNVPVTCVGHPIADEIKEPNKIKARAKLGLDASGETLLIGLLPGSRRSEVKKLGPVFYRAIGRIYKSNPDIQFVLPFANQNVAKTFSNVVGKIDHLPITTFDGQSRTAIEASDVVVLASGTAALEAALLRRPHVVVYKLSAITYWLFRRLRHVNYYSMPNQLLPNPVIPELVQEDATAENIVDAVNGYLNDSEKVQQLEKDCAEVHRQLKRDANLQASETIIRLLDASP